MGYFAEQSTKLQTLGFSLAESPVGPARMKLVTWTNAHPSPWTEDEDLMFQTNRKNSLPQCSRGCRFSLPIWIYYVAGQVVRFLKTTIPVSLSYFPKDLVQFPTVCAPAIFGTDNNECSWLRPQAKIVFESEHEVGDPRKMFGISGPATGGVSGCDRTS
ncbi:hypothetical protein EDB85DRAFT_1889128 [Lactarius pseudohatsudake]|nr:hypothetical protein EDB85DRAFT_1889128 [Lactarius pseudohatsudake]